MFQFIYQISENIEYYNEVANKLLSYSLKYDIVEIVNWYMTSHNDLTDNIEYIIETCVEYDSVNILIYMVQYREVDMIYNTINDIEWFIKPKKRLELLYKIIDKCSDEIFNECIKYIYEYNEDIEVFKKLINIRPLTPSEVIELFLNTCDHEEQRSYTTFNDYPMYLYKDSKYSRLIQREVDLYLLELSDNTIHDPFIDTYIHLNIYRLLHNVDIRFIKLILYRAHQLMQYPCFIIPRYIIKIFVESTYHSGIDDHIDTLNYVINQYNIDLSKYRTQTECAPVVDCIIRHGYIVNDLYKILGNFIKFNYWDGIKYLYNRQIDDEKDKFILKIWKYMNSGDYIKSIIAFRDPYNCIFDKFANQEIIYEGIITWLFNIILQQNMMDMVETHPKLKINNDEFAIYYKWYKIETYAHHQMNNVHSHIRALPPSQLCTGGGQDYQEAVQRFKLIN